jgi:hypothetical protein
MGIKIDRERIKNKLVITTENMTKTTRVGGVGWVDGVMAE